jgi:hypothetical protein
MLYCESYLQAFGVACTEDMSLCFSKYMERCSYFGNESVCGISPRIMALCYLMVQLTYVEVEMWCSVTEAAKLFLSRKSNP